MARRITVAMVMAAVVVACAWPVSASTFRVTKHRLITGVVRQQLTGSSGVVVNAAVVAAGAPVQLLKVKAQGKFETVTSMCRRVKCLAGVNGDFFTSTGKLATGNSAGSLSLSSDGLPRSLHNFGGRPVLGADELNLSPLPNSRHPRTLLGRTQLGGIILAVVDGRQPGYSQGMTLPQAIAMMRSLGAVEVVNLDGGGSSTFVVRGKVVNRPSDARVRRKGVARVVKVTAIGDKVIRRLERRVANAYLLVPKPAAKAVYGRVDVNVKPFGSSQKGSGVIAAGRPNSPVRSDNGGWVALAFCLLAVYCRLAMAHSGQIRDNLYALFGKYQM